MTKVRELAVVCRWSRQVCHATIYSQRHNYSLEMLCDLKCITFDNCRHTLRQISYHVTPVLLSKAEVKAFLILDVSLYCFVVVGYRGIAVEVNI